MPFLVFVNSFQKYLQIEGEKKNKKHVSGPISAHSKIQAGAGFLSLNIRALFLAEIAFKHSGRPNFTLSIFLEKI